MSPVEDPPDGAQAYRPPHLKARTFGPTGRMSSRGAQDEDDARRVGASPAWTVSLVGGRGFPALYRGRRRGGSAFQATAVHVRSRPSCKGAVERSNARSPDLPRSELLNVRVCIDHLVRVVADESGFPCSDNLRRRSAVCCRTGVPRRPSLRPSRGRTALPLDGNRSADARPRNSGFAAPSTSPMKTASSPRWGRTLSSKYLCSASSVALRGDQTSSDRRATSPLPPRPYRIHPTQEYDVVSYVDQGESRRVHPL